MKLTFDVQGLDQATRDLAQQFSARRLSAVAATAATRTANEIRTEIQAEMSRVFDRPTPYTLRSVRVKAATASSPVAEVFISQQKALRDPSPAVVLQPQVDGGARGVKGLELVLRRLGVLPAGWLVVPSKALPLDAYGNISRGQITQVLNQLGQDLSPGYARTISKSATKRLESARRSGRTYVAFARPVGRIKPGVYQRSGPGGRLLVPVFFYVSAVAYRKRVDLAGVAQDQAPKVLTREALRALDEHRAKLLAKGGA
jgi:hypothetical protein